MPVTSDERELERLSVNLTPKSSADLAKAMSATGLGKTDTANRAIQLYAWVVEEIGKGSELMFKSEDGSLSTVKLI